MTRWIPTPSPVLVVLVSVVSVVLAVGCAKTPVTPLKTGPSAGSETHWLIACEADADCDAAVGAACVCGLCTRSCAADADCRPAEGAAGAVDGRCVPAETRALAEVCGAAPPGPLCAAGCTTDAECGEGTRCTDDGHCLPVAEPPAPPTSPAGPLRFTVPERPKTDVLLVVDDSGSMCEEQSLLGRALIALGDTLAEADLRLAVITTDLRTETARGRFQRAPAPVMETVCPVDPALEPEVCDAALAAANLTDGVLRHAGGGDADSLATAAACLATRGTSGDGFEKGLEAMRLALACDGPQGDLYAPCCRDGVFDPACTAEVPFLRTDAALMIVLLSDEPDSSDPAANPEASRRAICKYGPADGDDADALPDGFTDPALCPDGPEACATRECDALDPQSCYEARCLVDRSDNDNALWHPEALTPVADYADFLRGLKRRPGLDLRVLPIVGPTPTLPDGTELSWREGTPSAACDPAGDGFDPARDVPMCCPEGVCTGHNFPACASANGVAYTGARYRELARAVCPPGADRCDRLETVSICDDTYELGSDMAALFDHMRRYACLADADAVVSEVLRDGGPLPADGYTVVDEPGCPSGRAVRLTNPVPGVAYEVR